MGGDGGCLLCFRVLYSLCQGSWLPMMSLTLLVSGIGMSQRHSLLWMILVKSRRSLTSLSCGTELSPRRSLHYLILAKMPRIQTELKKRSPVVMENLTSWSSGIELLQRLFLLLLILGKTKLTSQLPKSRSSIHGASETEMLRRHFLQLMVKNKKNNKVHIFPLNYTQQYF